MTKASEIFKKILGEKYSQPIPQPIGTNSGDDLVPNPEDARNHSNTLNIEDQIPLARKIGSIVDSISDDDVTEELADIVEKYLETVDMTGNMGAYDAALMLPLDQCQNLYDELKKYCDQNKITYSETNNDSAALPTSVPADLYPSSAGMIIGAGSDAPLGGFSL